MRVTLIHNPEAGSSGPSRETLIEDVGSAGYEVVYMSAEDDDFARTLFDPGDVVLVAGGDGTVATVARRLVGRGVPLAIVPLGTANNIAKSLGVRGMVEDTVRGLRDPECRALDVATARAPWGMERFVESAGVGIFATMLRDAARDEAISGGAGDRGRRRSRGSRLREVLDRSRARHVNVEADGHDLSGSYLLAVVMNTPCIGPGLTLAPAANPGDRRLDLVLLGEEDLSALVSYLEGLDRGSTVPFSVPSRQVTRVRLEWDRTWGHLDDEPWPREEEGDSLDARSDAIVEMEITEPSLTVMVSKRSSEDR